MCSSSYNHPSRNTTTLSSLLWLFIFWLQVLPAVCISDVCFAYAPNFGCSSLTATPDTNIDSAAVSVHAIVKVIPVLLLVLRPFNPLHLSPFSLPSHSVQCCLVALPINFNTNHNRKSKSDSSFAEHIWFGTGGLWYRMPNLPNWTPWQRWRKAYILGLLYSIQNSAKGTKQPIILRAAWHTESRLICDLGGRHGASDALTRHPAERQ